MTEKNLDQKTLALIDQVRARKAEISQAERPNYVTNMSFRKDENSRPVNLHVESSVSNLISIVAYLRREETSYFAASSELGLDKPPAFKWDGFEVNDWVNDIKTRLNKIQIKTKKEQLAKLEERLDKIISPELRAKLEIAAIERELAD